MKTFKHSGWKKRDYEATNLVACKADEAPSATWVECDESVLFGLQRLFGETQNGKTVWYYGYL